MKVLVDIKNALYDRVQNALEEKGCNSISSFVNAALENQLLYEGLPNGVIPDEDDGKQICASTSITTSSVLKELAIPMKASIVTVESPDPKQLMYKGMNAEEAFLLRTDESDYADESWIESTC